jgi:copper chaperone CopZ
MTTLFYKVPNISCAHCVHTIESELEELDGVVQVSTNLETKDVTLLIRPPATPALIESVLEGIHYPPVRVQ